MLIQSERRDMDDSWAALQQEEEPSTSQIPIDLFVSKKHSGRHLGFADSSGNVLYQVLPNSTHKRSFLIVDSAQNTLLSVHPDPTKKSSWHGYSGSSDKELLFRVQRTMNRLTRTELDVSLVGQTGNASDFKVKGFPFQRSCTVYKGDSIVAQTSLMYKLRQVFVSRARFRLTIYPGLVDHAFIVALIVIFLHC